jgi:hypothetical protein
MRPPDMTGCEWHGAPTPLEKRLEYVARLVAVILNGLAGPNALIPE